MIDGQPTTCEVCGVPFVAVRLSDVSEAPRLCELHAAIRREAEAKRAHTGGSPPPDAYRDVVLPERWRGDEIG